MRALTLIRHAKSSWEHPELSDFERPLNARGRRDAPLMGARYAAQTPTLPLLVSSPALRAITTAHAFADALQLAHTQIRIEPRIYEARPGDLLDLINHLDDAAARVCLFGHNPGLTEIARLLADCPFGEIPTCALVSIEFAATSWRDIIPGAGTVQRYWYPKDGGST